MKIKKTITIKERREPFVHWLLFSPTAFTITFRMALLMPPILMILLLIYTIGTGALGWSAFSTLMLLLTFWNLYKHREWFKTTPGTTIGRTIWKIDEEKEEVKKNG